MQYVESYVGELPDPVIQSLSNELNLTEDDIQRVDVITFQEKKVEYILFYKDMDTTMFLKINRFGDVLEQGIKSTEQDQP